MGSGTLRRSQTCHYCGRKATTEDHVVPRCDLPQPTVRQPPWFRALNVVPACSPCNNLKGDRRSSCYCEQCVAAWSTARALYGVVPRGVRQVPPLNEYAVVSRQGGKILQVFYDERPLRSVQLEHHPHRVRHLHMVPEEARRQWSERTRG